ncbi:MAG: cation:proton antiporter [Chitinophagaceae bacterium]|nr:cation:proton antiporter [Chitinophagaceae bacterium]MCB9045411.1 cation:proton antiporter [Chitinophagales bacterium]
MNHLPHLIQDLGLVLVVAGLTTLLFKWLKQPVVLGYILAGLIVGPQLTLFPTVSEIENIRIWADIGVIFLLFTLGLEFSFKKLINIGGPASVTGLIEISAMLGVGFILGRIMGWPLMDSIFLGGILSIASTTIIIRAFDELGIKGKKFADLVFGVLIIEDLVAVVLMVLLSTISVSREFAGIDMLLSILKLVFFLVLWFIAGIFFIPSFLSRVQKHLNDETLLVLAIGLCLFMVIFASKAGFSPALGAFIMGSILAETIQAERIEHIITPVKNLFGAVFFVSVGMLIDPRILVEYAGPILLITLVFIFFKVLHVTLGAVISGQPLRTAILAGMSMGQIGEFSFIIATLGVTLNVTSSYLYPIAVAVSALTTFLTPYMIKSAPALYDRVEHILPEKWKKTLVRYSTGAQNINTIGDWSLVLRSFFIISFFSLLISVGIIILYQEVVYDFVLGKVARTIWAETITVFFCLITISPFLWVLMMRKLQPAAFANLWANKRYHGPLIVLRLLRTGIAIGIIAVMFIAFLPIKLALAATVVLVGLVLFFAPKIHTFYLRVEDRFFFNFNHREIVHAKANRKELAPWDAHIAQYVLPVGSPCMGRSLAELAIREQTGVNIAMIKRGDIHTLIAPGRNERIYPGDRMFVIGTDEQLDAFKEFIQPDSTHKELEEQHEVVLKKIVVTGQSYMLNKTIRESGIREKTNGLVVGIERGGRRMLNPESTTIFEKDDKVWIVGDSVLIEELLSVTSEND